MKPNLNFIKIKIKFYKKLKSNFIKTKAQTNFSKLLNHTQNVNLN